jgi:PAS domain S-box-containing protein
LTGYSREEVLGADWLTRFVPAAYRSEILAAFHSVLDRGTPSHYRNPILTRAGKEITISWHNTPLRSDDGQPIGTLSLGEDVTEHARLEDQYRQAQKMDAVGRLAGGVAHDFNNLLTVISSYSDMLIQDLGTGDPRRADLEEIRKAAQGAASLTRQLLAFSRQQVIEPRNLALNDAVQAASKMLNRVIGEDIELAFLPGADPITVRMDPGQLEQIVMNLAINSRDAMPQGGKLTIETSAVTLDAEHAAAHWPSVPGRFALLAVSDTGIGMDEQTRARIFEPFFTTKEIGKGTGLGLATVYGIVKQSGGFIWVYSEPGQGAVFKIYLPLLDQPVATADQAFAPVVHARGTETILLAEDSGAVRTAAKHILERQGYTVIGAPSGKAAINILGKWQLPIHLLLTDVIMPEMSGRELAEEFLALRPDGKVLFMSGYTDDAVVLHGLLESGLAFLQKPFTPDALASKVREVLDKS